MSYLVELNSRCPPRLRSVVMGFWRAMARRAVRPALVAAWGCAAVASALPRRSRGCDRSPR